MENIAAAASGREELGGASSEKTSVWAAASALGPSKQEGTGPSDSLRVGGHCPRKARVPKLSLGGTVDRH